MIRGFSLLFCLALMLQVSMNGHGQERSQDPGQLLTVPQSDPDRIMAVSRSLLDKAGSEGVNFDKDIDILFYFRTDEPRVEDVVSGALDASFTRTANKNFGYRDDDVWIRFQIANRDADDLKTILTLNSLVTDYIELYEKGRPELLGMTGDMVLRSEKAMDSLMLSFPLEFGPHAERTFYARIQSSAAKEMKMSLRSHRHFAAFEHDAIWILACLMGGFVIMFFYNLGVSMAIRSLDYIVYSLLILLSFIREGYLLGIFPYFVFQGHPELAALIGRTSVGISIAVVAIFVVLFLDLSKKKGFFFWANFVLGAAALLTVVLQLVLGPKASISKLILLLIFSTSVLPVVTSLYHLIKGSREARFFLMAWSLACAGFGANVLIAAGIMPAGAYGLSFGLGGQFLELILLSFAFADKINRIRQDKIKATKQLQEQLQSFNARLQIQVKEKTRDIQSILDNIHQGIMPIQLQENSSSSQPGFMIAEDHSGFLQNIIGVSQLAHKDPFAVFFRKTELSVDQISQIESTLFSMIGESSLEYELNGHLLPHETILHSEAGDRILSMDWDAVVDEGSGTIVRILLVLKDMTDVRKLEEARQKQDKEIAIIGQIVKIDEVKYLEFLRLAEAYLSEAGSILSQLATSAGPGSYEQKDQIYRLLHTVKGLSRTYMMTEISDAVHEAETICHHWNDSDRPIGEQVTDLEERLNKTVTVLEEYKRLNFQVLGRRMEAVVRMDRSYIETAISAISRQLVAEDVDKAQIARVIYDFKKLYMKTIESLLSEDIKGLGNIAQKMGKALPRFIFRTDSSLFLRREIEAPLHAAFTHSLRNSIDHGIEKPDERTIKGKQAQGSIYISSEMSSDGTSVVIEIRDDGAGLKLDRIAAKACETGLINSPDLSSMSEEQIADLVFQPGFSTARNLTDISGRGVGMDSIRKAITDIGGDVRIILKGRLNDGAQAFATRLIIPIQHFDVWRVELTQQAA